MEMVGQLCVEINTVGSTLAKPVAGGQCIVRLDGASVAAALHPAAPDVPSKMLHLDA